MKQGVSSKTTTINIPLVGMIMPFAGSVAPAGWLFCDASSVSSSLYPQLYALVGATTPDLRGRFLVGDSGAPLVYAGSNIHSHNVAYGTTNANTVGYFHTHNFSAYPNPAGVYQVHNHAANHYPYISAFGNTTTSKSGSAQGNLTNRSHNHAATGGYWTANINAAGVYHTHYSTGTPSVNNVYSTHSHSVAASNTGVVGAGVAIAVSPNYRVNFIIKAG